MSNEAKTEYEILKMIQVLQPPTWVPLSSRGINVRALPTAGTIAGRLKIDKGLVIRSLRIYEKAGLVTRKKLIARDVAEPDYVTEKRGHKDKKGSAFSHLKLVYVYGLTEKGRVKLKYLDENKDAFSMIWLRRWLHRLLLFTFTILLRTIEHSE